MPALTVGAADPATVGPHPPALRARSLLALGLGLGAFAAGAWLGFSGRSVKPHTYGAPERGPAMGPRRKRVLAAGLPGLGSLLLALAVGTWFGGGPNDFRPAPAGGEAYEMGWALFVAKGCVTCHFHARVEYAGVRVGVGPDLTGVGRPGSRVPPSPGYLRAWLKNPPAIRPETQMPNLGLSDQEIDYLLAFLLNSP